MRSSANARRFGRDWGLRLKVFIVDDHRLMLEAVRAALEPEEDIEIVGDAQSGAEALTRLAQAGADICLLDVRMPGIDGITCLEQIRERYPAVRVVMLSGVDDPRLVDQALQRGASAFILKHVDPRDLVSAIRQVAEGSVFTRSVGPPAPTTEALRDQFGITSREAEILRRLSLGSSNQRIARELGVTEEAVKYHLTNLYRKLHVKNRTEAARFAFEHGLADERAYRAG
jgi:DNA-binding NarL/FixJ family response regulator